MKRGLVAPKTSAPTANPSVFGPSFSTTPDISDPSVSGYVCGKSLLPVLTNASQGPTPAAETRTRTSRSPGSGKMWVVDGLLTVRSSDGRQKTTQFGNARPAGLARLMLLELEDERAGDPSEG